MFRCDIGAYELNSDFSPPDFPTIDHDTGTALITPTLGITLSTHRPTFDWHDAVDAGGGTIVSYTLTITSSRDTISVQEAATNVTANQSFFTPTSNLPDAIYTWTVRAYDMSGNVSAPLPEATFAIAGSEVIYLPVVIKN